LMTVGRRANSPRRANDASTRGLAT
jgi:hypothetical protein